MRTEINKFHGFYWTEFWEEERWLEEQAKEGLLLNHRGIFFTKFEKERPVKRRYRIFNNMNDEEKYLIESSGWNCAEKNVFFTDAPETIEIITDLQGFRAHYGKLILSAVLHLFSMFCLILSNHIMIQRILNTGLGILHGYNIDLALAVADFLFLVLVILCYGCSIIKDIRYILQYGTGRQEKVRSYRKCILLNKVRWAACLFIAILMLVMFGFSLGNNRYHDYYGQEALDYQVEELVPFSVVDPAAFDNICEELLIAKDPGSFPMDSKALITVSVMPQTTLFEKSFEQSVEVVYDPYDPESGMDETLRCYSQTIYEARTESIAREYLNEEILIKGDVDANGFVSHIPEDESLLDLIEIPLDGVDYAGYETEEIISDQPERLPVQTLYLRKGTMIMIINYVGTENLKSKAYIFVQKM